MSWLGRGLGVAPFLRFQALLAPMTLAGDLDEVYAVGQPVDHGAGQAGIAGEDAGPFREGQCFATLLN